MCARTHTSWYNCPRRPKEDIGSQGTGVTGGCKPFDMLVLETELKFLETQKEHLTVSTRPINTHSVRLPVSSLQAAPSFHSDDSLFITVEFQPLWEFYAHPGMPVVMVQIIFSLRRELQVIFLGMSPEMNAFRFHGWCWQHLGFGMLRVSPLHSKCQLILISRSQWSCPQKGVGTSRSSLTSMKGKPSPAVTLLTLYWSSPLLSFKTKQKQNFPFSNLWATFFLWWLQEKTLFIVLVTVACKV